MRSPSLFFSCLLMAAFAVPAQSAEKPNLVYVLADDLGYGDLGCYGQKDIKTPNVDRLAAEGMRFTQHYAGSSVCAPSRCVLMTGLHTGHCYVRNNRSLPFEGNVPIPADSQTVAKLLVKAGYATACIGKWGLGYPGSEGDPNRQGFDHFFGYNCQRQAHSYYPEHLWRNQEKVILEGNRGGRETQYSHDLLTAEAIEFLREHHRGPFFLYLPYTIPHTKFQVPELGEYADEDWDEDQKIQAAMITRMDRDVGRIMELLKELRIDEKTLVMFTSDNGPHGSGGTLEKFRAAGPLRAKKGSFYEGGIRVPLVARWPGKIAPGTTSDHVCAFQDMLPTFAELAGVAVAQPIDGISIVPTLLGKGTQPKHEHLYWERADARALRLGDFKAVQPNALKNPDGPIQLFHLKDDLGEQHDLAGERPELVAKIRAIMNEAHEYSPFFDLEFAGEEKSKRSTRRAK